MIRSVAAPAVPTGLATDAPPMQPLEATPADPRGHGGRDPRSTFAALFSMPQS